MQNKSINQIPKSQDQNMTVQVISQEKQKLSQEIKTKILKAFFKERRQWKKDGQPKENLEGDFTLTVCEKICLGTPEDMISIPIEVEGDDSGYLHVYGIREIET